MFSCFSKKKKPISPSQLQENSTIKQPSTFEAPPEERLLPYTIPPAKTLKKSKFCPIVAQPKTGEDRSSSLLAIDRLLEEGLGEASLPVKEETGKFAKIQQQIGTSHFGTLEAIQKPTPQLQYSQDNHQFPDTPFRNTKSFSFDLEGLLEEGEEHHLVPKSTLGDLHTLEELTQHASTKKHRKRTKKTLKSTPFSFSSPSSPSSPSLNEQQFGGYDATLEQQALETTISLESFKMSPQRIQGKILEQLEDADLLEQTLEEAENSFYCGGLIQQLTRAVITSPSPDLAKRTFSKMTTQQKNSPNSKGYTPVQLLVLKAISNENFMETAKMAIHDLQVSLDCRGPTGWTPLQQALFYRSIPLATHLFRASYAKRHRQMHLTLKSFEKVLEMLPDFELQLEVKVDSFLPLVGSLAPSDTLTLRKRQGRLSLKYSLVGYQFPSCKRRDMEVQFDGSTLWAVNHSKGTYCDLLQALQQEEMILMIEDMLAGEMRRGWPIVHSASLVPSLSLFQNPICQSIAGTPAAKHTLHLCYTSTAQKRRSQTHSSDQLGFLSDLQQFRDRRESVQIKEKNRNKKVQLEVWLAQGEFGLELGQLLQMLEVLGMGNNFIGEWSRFLSDDVGKLIRQTGRFPLKIDIPLSYSLFFNIEFKSFKNTPDTPQIALPDNFAKLQRKEFQGTLQSRQKRALFIQAYT